MKDIYKDVRFAEKDVSQKMIRNARIKQTYRKTKQNKRALRKKKEMLKREQITEVWRVK